LGRTFGLSSWFVPPDFYPERVVTTQTWVEAVFEPLSLIGALICFVVGVVQLGLVLAPNWPAQFVVPLSGLVGVEAFIYSRRLSRGSVMPKEWLTLLAPVVILERALDYLADPNSSVVSDVAQWLASPLSFFTASFIADTLILFVAWLTIFWCTQYLNQLRVQPGELTDESSPTRRDRFEESSRALDHSAPLRQLGQVFVTGGVVLVICAALASLGTSQFLSFEALGQIFGLQRPSLHLVQANVVGYFVLGLGLLGECHFVRQRTLWRLDHIAMPSEVANRWIGSLAVLIVVGLAVAFILPTSYAMTIGDIISTMAAIIAQIFLFIGGALFYLAYIIATLLPFFKGGGSDTRPAEPPRPPPVARPTAGPSIFDLLGSILFWVVALGVVTYALYAGWQRRPAWLAMPRIDTAIGRFVGALLALIRLGRRAGRNMLQAIASVAEIWRRPAPLTRPKRGFISLSRLGPAQLIEYYYLSICERAARIGYARPSGATPAEFERTLVESLPVLDPELAELTDAFVEARYGPRLATKQNVARVKPEWQALKRKLRDVRNRRPR
jgi:hypothetical protein